MKYKVKNAIMEVVLGDITKEDVDIIVNAAHEALNKKRLIHERV